MINSTRCAFVAKQACATFSKVVRKITPPHANNLLKFFFALFAILTLNAATAWGAEEVTLWDKNNPYVASDTEKTSSDGIVKWKNSASNTYSAPTRIYKNNVLTITASYKIVKVQFVCAASDTKDNGPGHFSSNVGTYSYSGALGTWTGEANSIQFTASGGQVRIHSVTVTYESTGGDDPDEPGTGGDSDCVWQLVSDASTLAVGDEIIIAAADYNYALSTNQKSNNRGQTSITKKGDNISEISSDVQIITLETGNVANTFAFNTGSAGYLYAVSSSSNYLRTKTTLDNNGSWKITITDDGTSVAASGTNTCNQLNYNQSSSLFSCYPSDKLQKPIVLYKKVCAVAQTYSVKKGTLENCTLKFGKTEDNFTNDELTGLAEKDYVYFTITPSSGYELKGEPVIKDASDNNVECVEEDGVWMFEMPASDVTVSVSCVSTVKTYKVTFNANGHGTAPTAQNVEENTKATEPNPAPSATGYTFGGWYTDQACSDDKKFDFNTPITEDITLYAKWTINQYTVTLNPNYPEGQTGTFTDKEGNSVDKVELKYDYNTTSISLTDLYNSIKLEGYQFNGWYSATSGGSKWTETGEITSNVTVYAQWSKLYTITLSENGKETTLTPQTATSYTLPTVLSAGSCQDDTKEFVGWTTNQELSSETTPTSDFYEKGEIVTLSADATTFYAVFATVDGGGFTDNTNVYTSNVTLDNTGGTNATNSKVKISEVDYTAVKAGTGSASGAVKITVPAGTTKLTFHIAGWNKEGGKTISLTGAIATPSSFTTVADAGVSGNSTTYTLSGTIANYFYSTTLSNINVETTLTFSNGGADQRFVIWGVNASAGATYSNYSTTCVPAPKLVSIAANAEGKDEFTVGDEFVKAVITATYDDATTKEVTSLATFTGYDMNTTGTQTVNVEYEGKTTSYKITVNPKPTYTITWNSIGVEVETTIVQGEPLGELSTVADCPSGKKFMGWTAATEVNNDGSDIVYVKETDIPTSDMTYYAVFAVVTSTGEPVTSYKKVTTISDGTYLIAATSGTSSYAYTGQVESKKFGGYIGVTIENDEITTKPVEASEITVKVTDGKFSMHDGSKYLYLSSSDNELHYNDAEQIVWALDADGKINITTYETRYLRFNAQSGNERFACYSSAQKDAFLHKKVTTTPETVSDYSLDCTIHTEPTWTISKDAIDFADKYVGVSYTETFTISASNLTDDIALAIDGSNFTVSPTSIATDAEFPQTVTVTYAPTAAGSHNATLSITSGSTLSKSIALTGSATEATIYTLTALADIKPTDKVIIVGTNANGNYAMSNDNGTSEAPDAVAVEVADNKIATNETNILWNIAKNGDNLTIYPADQTAKWLYCLANENNGVRVGSNTNKTFIFDATSGYLQHTGTSRYLGIYNNSDWRCYTSYTTDNIKDQSFAFYVLPNTDPSISVSPASKDFGAVASRETATQEFEITTMNLTQALSAELTGEGFSKSDIVDNKITITFAPTEEKDYSATLTISAGAEATASVTISGKGVAATYSVTYDKNGAEGDAPTDETKYVANSKVTIAGQGDMTMAGYRFAGWKYGEDTYKAGAKFTMPTEDVTFVAQWVEKEDFSTGYWVLVNDASELAADDYVVIAAAEEDLAMKSYENGNNCGQVVIKKSANLLIWNENVGVFQLLASGSNYTIQDVNTEQYLYAAGTGSNNYLKANDEVPADAAMAKYVWTVSFTDGVPTVKATSDNRNTLMYNTSSNLFSCYEATSDQKDIALYKYVTELPTIELNSDDNSAVITANAGKTVNVKLNRSFTANVGYYTLCLPFDIAASEIGKAYELGTITEYEVDGGININLTEVEHIEAGKPYLVLPKTLTKPIFENVTIVNTTGETIEPASVAVVKVTFTGIINGVGEQTDGETEYYVGDEGKLYNGKVDKLGLRAFFTITDGEGQAISNVRARVVAGENVETGVEDIITTDAPVKVIENGQLIIIRDGVKYNVQGQRL